MNNDKERVHCLEQAYIKNKKTKFEPAYHLKAPVGWLNDPNGLCQYLGVHHVFFQYSPDSPRGDKKYWGHYETEDFVNYRYTGIFLSPDSPADRDGAFSGSAFVENGEMHVFYTGNVEGDGDLILNGREGNTIYVRTKDGVEATDKIVVLRNTDYPDNISCHVRDPKVWKEDFYYMVLGARSRDDRGCILIYQSDNLTDWQYVRTVESLQNFGYMWECPDIFRIGDKLILSMSPQGLKAEEYRFMNAHQSGYIISAGDIESFEPDTDAFIEWDMGFDFYAPQTYMDENGRRILIGWMGVSEQPYDSDPSIDEGWQHMLTVPRELSYDNETGRLRQWPVAEIEKLRIKKVTDMSKIPELSDQLNYSNLPRAYDLTLRCGDSNSVESKNTNDVCESNKDKFGANPDNIRVIFDKGLVLSYDAQTKIIELVFIDELMGCGRTARRIKLDDEEVLEDIRVLRDVSCMEIYINGGLYVMSAKLYSDTDIYSVKTEGACQVVNCYEMGSIFC